MSTADRRTLVVAAARVNYRALVLENTLGDPGWRDPAWLDQATCADDPAQVQVEGCEACTVWLACLTTALVLDEQAPVRAGLTLPVRAELFSHLEGEAVALEPWLAGHPGRNAAGRSGA